jgi:adenosylmethionine-8-amino-7-oxononanoate aminotransferase
MNHVFYRHTKSEPPVAARGEGMYIIDATGKRYLDGSGGAAVSSLGHNHPRVVDAIKAQLDNLPFAHTGFFTSDPAEQLADELIAQAPRASSGFILSAAARKQSRRH